MDDCGYQVFFLACVAAGGYYYWYIFRSKPDLIRTLKERVRGVASPALDEKISETAGKRVTARVPEELEKEINESLIQKGLGHVSVSISKDYTATVVGTASDANELKKAIRFVRSFREIRRVREKIGMVAERATMDPVKAEGELTAPCATQG